MDFIDVSVSIRGVRPGCVLELLETLSSGSPRAACPGCIPPGLGLLFRLGKPCVFVAHCIARLGDPACVVVAAAMVKTSPGTALQCGGFEEN